jgi:hypothetical protein
MGEKLGLLLAVIGFAIGPFEALRLGQRNHVAKAADIAGDHVVILDARDQRTIVIAPGVIGP